MLTRRQLDLLRFIHQRLTETGVAPSFDEMQAELGLRSRGSVHRLIVCLEQRGFIRRLPNRARAIEVIKLPQNMGGQIVNPAGSAGNDGGQIGYAPFEELAGKAAEILTAPKNN